MAVGEKRIVAIKSVKYFLMLYQMLEKCLF